MGVRVIRFIRYLLQFCLLFFRNVVIVGAWRSLVAHYTGGVHNSRVGDWRMSSGCVQQRNGH